MQPDTLLEALGIEASYGRVQVLWGVDLEVRDRETVVLLRPNCSGNPRLLAMDEPSAGLSPLFVKEVLRVLAQFRERGLTFLIAEQNVKFLELADRVYTLDGGRIGFTGSVAAMHENDALRKAYFGLK